MHDVVAVGMKLGTDDVSCHLVPCAGFRRTFLNAPFFHGRHQEFATSIQDGRNESFWHVPTTAGYILFDFTDRTIVSWQTAASVDTVPRSVMAEIYDHDVEDGAAVARAITHRDNMGEGIRPAGPFDGSERDEICRYASVHERFSTFHFTIPGWTRDVGLLTATSCEKALANIATRVDLSDWELSAWRERIASIRSSGLFECDRREAA